MHTELPKRFNRFGEIQLCYDWSSVVDHRRYPSWWIAVALYLDEGSLAATGTALTVGTDVRELDEFWTVEWAFLF